MKRQARLPLNLFAKAVFRFALLFVFATTAAAQQSGGGGNNSGRTGGVTHTVRGKIFLPSGNLPEQRMRVVLEINSGGIASEAFSDSVGNFEFRGLANGSYKVSIPSDNHTYETAQENIEAFGNFARTFTVQIYLKEKINDSAITPSHKVLSAADLQDVPKGAKKAYEQGLKLARENKPEDACAKLQESLKVFPDYLYALNKLGELYLAMNKVS